LTDQWVWPFRVLCLILSIPFIYKIYVALSTGVATSGRYTYDQGGHWGFYAYVFKYVAFAFLFVWLGTLGTQKKQKDTNEK
jgi:uncharacterized membrane protein